MSNLIRKPLTAKPLPGRLTVILKIMALNQNSDLYLVTLLYYIDIQ